MPSDEFDRQAAELMRRRWVAPEDLEPLRALAPEGAPDVDAGRLPFVLFANGVPPEEWLAACGALDGLHPVTAGSFRPTVELPDERAWLLLDVDRETDTRNRTPDEAAELLRARGRTPLTLEEGLATLLSFPAFVRRNHGASLPGSRRGDRRVAGLWVSEGRPKLGWCWAGNPHPWLGSASCVRRLGAR